MRSLAKRELPQRDQCGLAEEVLQRPFRLLPAVNHSPLQTVEKGARREVDHHDLWQRAGLVMSCVGREMGELHELLDSADRWLHGQEWVVARIERRIVTLDD